MIGKPMNSAPNLEENDAMHEKMKELEPLLEASGERNLRSIDITHWECPCTAWHKRCGPGSRKPLLNMGCVRDSVDRITRSQTKGDTLGGEHDAGFAMDRTKCDEISGVEDTNGKINIRYRLQQET